MSTTQIKFNRELIEFHSILGDVLKSTTYNEPLWCPFCSKFILPKESKGGVLKGSPIHVAYVGSAKM